MKQQTFHCKNGLIIASTELQTLSRPYTNCPCCGNRRAIAETDGWDYYALRLNLTHSLTYTLLNTFNRTIDSFCQTSLLKSNPTNHTAPTYRKATYSNTPNGELAELSFQQLARTMPNRTHGTCTFNANCTKCGSGFTFSVSDDPRTIHRPLEHCPYGCGKHLVISPASNLTHTERSMESWLYLANIHEPPVHTPETELQTMGRIASIQSKYEFWEQYGTNFKTFAEFLVDFPNRLQREFNAPENVKVRQVAAPKPKSKKKTIRIVLKGSK